MNFDSLMRYCPSNDYYNLKDKLLYHITNRSLEAFRRAEKVREAIETKEELIPYQAKRKKFFLDMVGEIPYDPNRPLYEKVHGVIDEKTLRIEKITFESREGVRVSANLYIPKERKEPAAGILFQIGHAEQGKSWRDYQRVARTLAESGLVVLIMDPIGQGERLEYIDKENGTILVHPTVEEHQYFGNQCFLMGNTPIKYFVSDAKKAIDYLISRPEVDPDKIGITGSSGGGTMTTYLMLLDDRVQAAAPGTFLTTREDYYFAGGAQDAEQIWPGATEKGFDHYELVTCFCPKPLMILAVDSDFFPYEGTQKIYQYGKKMYRLYDKEDQIGLYTDQSGHRYSLPLAEKAAAFFCQVFYKDSKKEILGQARYLEEKLLHCTRSGQIYQEFQDQKRVYQENAEMFEKCPVPTQEETKTFLENKIYRYRAGNHSILKNPEIFSDESVNAYAYLWNTQKMMWCYGIWLEQKNISDNSALTILLLDEGTDDVKKKEKQIEMLLRKGNRVLIVDLSATGKNMPYDTNAERETKGFYGTIEKAAKDLMFLDDSLCALRCYELMETIKLFRNAKKPKEVILSAEGKSCLLARIAAFLDDTLRIALKDEISIEEIIRSQYYDSYNSANIIFPEIGKYWKTIAQETRKKEILL